MSIPGLQHRCRVGLVPERHGPLEEGQPVAVLHEEAEVIQHMSQVAGTVLQVHSVVSGDIQQRLSLQQKRDKARLSKVTNTASRLIGRPVPDPQAQLSDAWRPPSGTALARCVKSCRPLLLMRKLMDMDINARSSRLVSFWDKASRFRSLFLPAAVQASVEGLRTRPDCLLFYHCFVLLPFLI